MDPESPERLTQRSSEPSGATNTPLLSIPDYEVLKRIGGGSYGDVWLARSMLGTWRAVKVVYRNSFEHDKPLEREFKGIQRFEPISLTHESQVKILHVGRNDAAGYFYYVMELADDGAENPKSEILKKPEIRMPNQRWHPSLFGFRAWDFLRRDRRVHPAWSDQRYADRRHQTLASANPIERLRVMPALTVKLPPATNSNSRGVFGQSAQRRDTRVLCRVEVQAVDFRNPQNSARFCERNRARRGILFVESCVARKRRNRSAARRSCKGAL